MTLWQNMTFLPRKCLLKRENNIMHILCTQCTQLCLSKISQILNIVCKKHVMGKGGFSVIGEFTLNISVKKKKHKFVPFA